MIYIGHIENSDHRQETFTIPDNIRNSLVIPLPLKRFTFKLERSPFAYRSVCVQRLLTMCSQCTVLRSLHVPHFPLSFHKVLTVRLLCGQLSFCVRSPFKFNSLPFHSEFRCEKIILEKTEKKNVHVFLITTGKFLNAK